MGDLLGPEFPSDIGLAVSGGGDSMAMLTLAHNWTRVWGVRLWVVTVDHGLRDAAADEARLVAETCAELGWPHATIRWRWDGQGNVMDAARRARLRLIDAWRGDVTTVLMAHTEDDVAETFVMRLARGSGVEGLSAIAPARRVMVPDPATLMPEDVDGASPPAIDAASQRAGFCIVRPCLGMARGALRHYLRTLKGTWVEDPTNDDPHYARAQARRALATLGDMGLSTETLVETAQRLARSRAALSARAVDVWRAVGNEDARTGDLTINRDGFATVERDTQMRLLAAALQYVSGSAYRPRATALEALLDRALAGGGGTLLGCLVIVTRDTLRIAREYAAVADLRMPLKAKPLWDGRWRVTAQETANLPDGAEVRALGAAGWALMPEDARTHPFAAAQALPSIWAGDALLACPALDHGVPARATLCPMGQRHAGLTAFLKDH